MTLQFNQFNEITEGLHLLNEKQIIVGGGANYGQIVFLVGGAGSGKGFALKHFLQGTKFKVRDVDAWKAAFLKLAALKQKQKPVSTSVQQRLQALEERMDRLESSMKK